jgi:hypothetical protein
VGRWTTPDPVWFKDGPNLYTYVQNNPILFVDPNGLTHEAADNRSNKGHFYFRHYESIAHCIRCFMILPLFFTNPDDDKSKSYKTEGTPNEKIAIVFCNGILNTFAGAEANAKKISEMAGGSQVRGVYNCTYGVLDIIECALGLLRIGTDPVEELHKLWDEEFARMGENGIIIQECHSQGCIHVRNALERYDPAKRKNIHLIATAPGGYISEDICGSVIHLVSKRDFVPYLDFIGRSKNKQNIVMLDPHPDAHWWDHNFDSKTYTDARRDRHNDIMKEYGGK